MRDPNRLDSFYNELKKIHKENFPDWRFGQLFFNLQQWSGSDFFYIEEDEYLNYLKQFIQYNKKMVRTN